MKKSIKTTIIAVAALLLLTALYFFVIPVKITDVDAVRSISVAASGERTELAEEEMQPLLAAMGDTRARRVFSPSQLTESEESIMLDLVNGDGALHIILNDDAGFVYSSADDLIWYRISDPGILKNAVNTILQ